MQALQSIRFRCQADFIFRLTLLSERSAKQVRHTVRNSKKICRLRNSAPQLFAPHRDIGVILNLFTLRAVNRRSANGLRIR